MSRRYLLATALYCAALFVLSSDTSPPQPAFLPPGTDKLAHAVLYAGLAAVVSLGIRRAPGTATASVQFWVPFLFAALYGVSDEVHQLFVPNRSFEMGDIVADATGALAIQCALCRWVWRARATD